MNTPPKEAHTNTLASAPAWWRLFLPAPLTVNRRERVRVVVGAALGMAVTAALSHWAGRALGPAWPWLVAPMGASAVLVFGVSSSPMAQPWAVVASHTSAVLVGIACAHAVAPPEVAGMLAVGASIGVMFALRCMHPPAGGTALMMTLGMPTDPMLALFPVALNAGLLVLMGVVYHHATRHHYPHGQGTPPASRPESSLEADLDAVLTRYNQVLDITREDLQALLHQTQLQSYQHKLERLLCADIMARDLVTVEASATLKQARTLLHQHDIKALPVVDGHRRLVGILTRADLMRVGANALTPSGLSAAAQSTSIVEETPSLVRDIMTRQVRVASQERHLAELIPLFGSTGHHHIPIIDADGTLVGMVTQTDVVAALCRPEERTQP